ncbi:MAG TPA: LysR substrate-binding domain-containing protein [Chloroflexota bacterium]|nr:LysR substrate-binding domain-containing protein [Chloroflexota bacterium]
MQPHQLEYFLAVARRLHFTRAADELHVAQPSVSQQIRKLEDELGAQLFHRMKRRVTLTAAGEALLPWARRVLADLAEARAEVQELAGLRRGRLAVGATPSVSTVLLPRALAAFQARYPGVSLVFREAGSGDLIRSLEQGELDLAVLTLPVRHPALETSPLLEEELVVAAPPDHPLASRPTVAIEDLREVPMIMLREGYNLRGITLAACRRAGFDPRIALDGAEMDSVLRFVAAGLGAAVVPSMVIPPNGQLPAIRLDPPTLTRTLALAHRRDRSLSRAAAELAALVREVGTL